MENWHDRITRLGFSLGAITLCGIVLCFWIEVVARYFFNSPTFWSSSMVSYLFCISVSLAIPELARTHGHIAITVLPDTLSVENQARYQRVIALLSAGVCLLATWIFIQENIRQITGNTTTALGLDIPKYWISIFITYGFGNTALHFLRHAFNHGKPQGVSADTASGDL